MLAGQSGNQKDRTPVSLDDYRTARDANPYDAWCLTCPSKLIFDVTHSCGFRLLPDIGPVLAFVPETEPVS
ncbi:hypothetical protein XH92_37610 [Bradyrhizobium sp. CCBAU 53421]|nr:hypothetical protein XH92_37610 [Bradyrhizobium sp. CCBAU 53421]